MEQVAGLERLLMWRPMYHGTRRDLLHWSLLLGDLLLNGVSHHVRVRTTRDRSMARALTSKMDAIARSIVGSLDARD